MFSYKDLLDSSTKLLWVLGKQNGRERGIHHLLGPEGDTARSLCITADTEDGESMVRPSRSLEGADGCFLYSLIFEKE